MKSTHFLKLGSFSLLLSMTPGGVQAACSAAPQTLSGSQSMFGKTLEYQVSITKDGNISNATFACDADNQGWVSNSTIKAGATLRGGVLTGYIVNEGTIADIEFLGASLKGGGTLAGKIVNSSRVGGTFKNIKLAANAEISGGVLEGDIVGDETAPATLNNVKVKAGSKLTGVTLGKNVKLGKGVVIKPVLATPLKIGGLFSFTGSWAEFGTKERDAALLAVKHLNGAGYAVELKVADDGSGSDPATGVKAAKSLVTQDKVPVLVGPLASRVTIPVAEQVTIPNQVLQISHASTSSFITTLEADKSKDLLFRTIASDGLAGTNLAKLTKVYDKVAILYGDDAYGQSISEAFANNFEKQGGTVVAKLAIAPNYNGGYPTKLTEAAKNGAQVLVVLTTYMDIASTSASSLALARGLFHRILFVDFSISEELVQQFGADNLEGLCGAVHGVAPSTSLDNLSADYQAEYGKPLDEDYLPNIYDATILTGLAAYAAQTAGKALTGVNIRDYLRQVANPPGESVVAGAEGIKQAITLLKAGKAIDYQGASGDVNFDDHGDVSGIMAVRCFEGGKLVTMSIDEALAKWAATTSDTATTGRATTDTGTTEPVSPTSSQ